MLVWFLTTEWLVKAGFHTGVAGMRPTRRSPGHYARDHVETIRNNIGLRGDSPFWGWLRQIAFNESLMRFRKRHPGNEIEPAYQSDFLEADILLPRKRPQA